MFFMPRHAPSASLPPQEPRAETVPRLIISLERRYLQYIYRNYRRTGTLWDSRYKSSLIQAETYLLTYGSVIRPSSS